MNVLAKLKEDCGDEPEDYLRDLAGAIRHGNREGKPFEITQQDTEILEAIADEIERLRAALEPFANAADGRRSKDLRGSVCFGQDHLLRARAALQPRDS